MGMVDPWTCSGNTILFADRIRQLLSDFCQSCQTDDRIGGCDKCPAFIMFDKMKEYILDDGGYNRSYYPFGVDSDGKTDEYDDLYNRYNKSLKLLQRELKKIKVSPFLNSGFMLSDSPKKDIFAKYDEHLSDLKYYNSRIDYPFGLNFKRKEYYKKVFRRAKLDWVTGEATEEMKGE